MPQIRVSLRLGKGFCSSLLLLFAALEKNSARRERVFSRPTFSGEKKRRALDAWVLWPASPRRERFMILRSVFESGRRLVSGEDDRSRVRRKATGHVLECVGTLGNRPNRPLETYRRYFVRNETRLARTVRAGAGPGARRRFAPRRKGPTHRDASGARSQQDTPRSWLS